MADVELHHRFTVPAGIDEAWAHFTDIAGVADCFPGATVTEADPESFSGTVKVKLGPIALVYNGTGTFEELDEAGRRMVIDARGKDKRGNGTAGAKVTLSMAESAPGSTDVEVDTDLSITGKAAQFGRGNVISDVSDKLLGQFVTCLEQRFAEQGEGGSTPEAAAASGPTAPADPAAAASTPDAPSGVGPAPVPSPGDATTPPPPEPPAREQPAQRAGASPSHPQPEKDDAIDLGSTVLPVLARAYWKPALAVVVVVLVIWWLIARD